MRNTRKILVALLVLMTLMVGAFAVTASAAAGQTWTVAGVKALCGTDWDTANKNNDMTYDSATDSYVKVYENVKAGTYQFKCAKDHKWDVSYGNGSANYNLKVDKDGSTVTITLKGTTVTAKVEAPACDHKYEVTSTTVTCLTGGNRTWTCSVCGDSYTEEKLDALGHSYDANGQCVRCDATTTFIRVYVNNAAKWANVYCYTWDTNPYVAWPGAQMAIDEATGYYYYDIPENFVNVIFNNGGSTQSADLKTPTGKAVVYNNSTKAWSELHTCSFSDATCTEPAKCECGKTQGEALGHTWDNATCEAPKTCSVCKVTEGEALGHTYVLDVCLVCYDIKPSYQIGENAITNGTTNGAFGMFVVEEAGTYWVVSNNGSIACIFTTPVGLGADFSIAADGTLGASWYVFSIMPVELQPGLYYAAGYGIGDYTLTIMRHDEHTFVEGKCACGAVDPDYVPPHEHSFVEGKCECGEVDPNYTKPEQPAPEQPAPEQPAPELSLFEKIMQTINELIAKITAWFKSFVAGLKK